MKYPIIVNENGNIFFIDSEKGINYLEAIDVLNREYTAYDSSGLPLELSVSDIYCFSVLLLISQWVRDLRKNQTLRGTCSGNVCETISAAG